MIKLTDQELDANLKHYFDLLRSTKAAGVDDLIYYLDTQTDIRVAPASTKYHLCVPGGLIIHKLGVYNRLDKLIETEGLYSKYSKRNVIISSLCHDLVKVNYYRLEARNVKVEDPNAPKGFRWETKMEYRIIPESERLVYGLHGENSLYVTECFIKDLTYDEKVAIRWHMGCMDWQDSQAMISTMSEIYNRSELAFLLHVADSMACYLDEKDM